MRKLLTAVKHRRDLKLIKESQLFDETYYVTHHPEVLVSPLAPLEHYLKVGSNAGMRPNAFFDDAYYRAANPDVRNSKVNPLVHFIKHGAKELRNPSRTFDTRFYIESHPDVAEKGLNPLWHFLTYGASENRETDDARKQALSDANRALYEELVQIEPLLPPFADLPYATIDRGPVETLADRAFRALINGMERPFTHLLVLNRLIHGGAATLGMYYARLVKEVRGAQNIVVLLVDEQAQTAIHLLPEGVKLFCLDDLQPGLSQDDRLSVLTRFILQMQPQVVHNIDSDVCWQAFQRYHKQLSVKSSLAASLFMFCYNEAGVKVGFASDYVNRCIDGMQLLLTDNNCFRNELCEFYALEQRNQDKIHVAYTPIISQFFPPDPEGAESRSILWSSRLHKDKRPDLLLEIARQMPEFTFEIYGSTDLDAGAMSEIKTQSNIKLHGPYKSSNDLPRQGIAAYLHTTRHEGGAITMKEAIAAGLPAIAPGLGVIPDIINDDTGWLVTDADNPAAYAKAIRECVSNPQERVRRVINAQRLLKNEHSWHAFVTRVTAAEAYHLPIPAAVSSS